MKFQFEKLGALDKKTEIELGDLTIICGKNNTGKTYISYAIYGFLKHWKRHIHFKLASEQINRLLKNGVLKLDLQTFEKDIHQVVEGLSQRYTQSLPAILSANEDYFSETLFRAVINADYQPNYQLALHCSQGTKNQPVLEAIKEKEHFLLNIISLVKDESILPPATIINRFINVNLGKVLLGDYFANPFMMTSERTGIALFHKKLYRLEPTDYEFHFSQYSLPIENEIDFTHHLIESSKRKSKLIKAHPELLGLLKDIVGGEYQVADDQIYFIDLNVPKNPRKIPLYMASSAVKSLLDLSFYLKHIAKKGDILLIDEPEQYLHPANQRKIARLFVRLIKAGIKVFVTTQSDYLIKELNHLILLGNEFEDKEEIMKKYGYTKEDILNKSLVQGYIAEKQTLFPATIDEMGIEVNSFDREINEMNRMYNDITVTMECAYDN